MKQIINKTLLVILIFVAVTCKDSPTESNRVNQVPSYSISGIVYDVVSNDYSPGVKKGAVIYFDKDSTFSDEEGKFIFNKISKGDHLISISLPLYEVYSRKISVQKDTNITIYLYGKKEDYFPLKDSSRIKYKYHSSSSSIVYSIEDIGEAEWNIRKVINSTNYKVDETIIYKHIFHSPLYSETLDTLINSFTMTADGSTISFRSSILDGVSFSRYNDVRQGEVITKTFTNPGSVISTINIYLKKNVGLTKIFQFGSGGRWSKTYELIGQ